MGNLYTILKNARDVKKSQNIPPPCQRNNLGEAPTDQRTELTNGDNVRSTETSQIPSTLEGNQKLQPAETTSENEVGKHERYRFSFIVNELKTTEVIAYKRNLLTFINCILSATDELYERSKIRGEFTDLNIETVLKELRKLNDDKLTIQCETFEQDKRHDDGVLTLVHNFNRGELNQHQDMFIAICQNVLGTPHAESFLGILQSLKQIDSKHNISDHQWTIMESIAQNLLYLDKSLFLEKLLVDIETEVELQRYRSANEYRSETTPVDILNTSHMTADSTYGSDPDETLSIDHRYSWQQFDSNHNHITSKVLGNSSLPEFDCNLLSKLSLREQKKSRKRIEHFKSPARRRSLSSARTPTKEEVSDLKPSHEEWDLSSVSSVESTSLSVADSLSPRQVNDEQTNQFQSGDSLHHHSMTLDGTIGSGSGHKKKLKCTETRKKTPNDSQIPGLAVQSTLLGCLPVMNRKPKAPPQEATVNQDKNSNSFKKVRSDADRFVDTPCSKLAQPLLPSGYLADPKNDSCSSAEHCPVEKQQNSQQQVETITNKVHKGSCVRDEHENNLLFRRHSSPFPFQTNFDTNDKTQTVSSKETNTAPPSPSPSLHSSDESGPSQSPAPSPQSSPADIRGPPSPSPLGIGGSPSLPPILGDGPPPPPPPGMGGYPPPPPPPPLPPGMGGPPPPPPPLPPGMGGPPPPPPFPPGMGGPPFPPGMGGPPPPPPFPPGMGGPPPPPPFPPGMGGPPPPPPFPPGMGGPPPPPPFPPGMGGPPPPPGMGGPPPPPQTVPVSRTQYIKKPSQKLRSLQWTKVPSNVLKDKNVWQEIRTVHSTSVKVDYDLLENMFCVKATQQKATEKQQKTVVQKKINLLNRQRSLDIAILLRNFKASQEIVVNNIRDGKTEAFGLEKLRQMEKNLPTDDEMSMLNSHQDDPESLADPERFCVRLSKIPFYRVQIVGMLLMEEKTALMQTLRPNIEKLKEIFHDLMENKELKAFFALTLQVGNFMNSDRHAGNAMGFEISSAIKILNETKGNESGINLLHYLVIQAEESNCISFVEQLQPKVQSASRLSTQLLQEELTNFANRVNKLNMDLKKCDESLKNRYGSFIKETKDEVVELQKQVKEIEALTQKLCAYFCEKEKEFNLEVFLNHFNKFLMNTKQCQKDNKQRRIKQDMLIQSQRKKDQKIIMAKEQQQQKFIMKDGKKCRRRRTIDVNIVDSLANMICNGFVEDGDDDLKHHRYEKRASAQNLTSHLKT